MVENFLGLAIGGTKTSISLGRSDGSIIRNKVLKTKKDHREVLEDIYKEIDTVFDSGISCKAIGISCGGPLDPVRGLILSPPNLPSWDAVPIVNLIQSRYSIPCFLENDANSGVLAEYLWGNGVGAQNIIFLTFGTGMGAGMILNGRLYSGASGLSGEIGHIRVAEEGPLCYGKVGSLESFCSGTGLEKLYSLRSGKDGVSAKEICDLAEYGDKTAIEIIRLSSFYLGRGLAVLTDLMNPERIIIGSIFSRRENLFRPGMEQIWEEEALELARDQCQILPSGLGELSGEKGALAVSLVHSDQVLKEKLYG